MSPILWSAFVALSVVACADRGRQGQEPNNESAIQEAVFAYRLAADSASYGSVRGYCLALETRESYTNPPASIINTFSAHEPPVWPLASCRSTLDHEPLVQHDTVTMFIRPIRYHNSSTAEVTVRYWRGGLSGAHFECTLAKRASLWKVQKCEVSRIS
jgi:hypothetical protein